MSNDSDEWEVTAIIDDGELTIFDASDDGTTTRWLTLPDAEADAVTVGEMQ